MSNDLEARLLLVAENETLRSRLAAAEALLRVAECPNHCIDGAMTVDRGGEWEQEQCQFCYERDAFLAKKEGTF